MSAILRCQYPLLKMHELCRACKGNPKYFIQREKCLLCKRNRAEWIRQGFENECNEMLYLHTTWMKCKKLNMQSTGIHGVDSVIVHLFGMPNDRFGSIRPNVMPKKVSQYTKEYVQGPIHLNLTGREEKALVEKGRLQHDGNYVTGVT